MTLGLEEYETSKMLKYNEETSQILSLLLDKMQKTCCDVLNENFGTGEAWYMNDGMPHKIYSSCFSRSVKHRKETGLNREVESFLTFDDIKSIASYKDNWGKLFQSIFTLTEPQYTKGSKATKLSWITRLRSIEKDIAKRTSVSQEDYDFVIRLRNNWLSSS